MKFFFLFFFKFRSYNKYSQLFERVLTSSTNKLLICSSSPSSSCKYQCNLHFSDKKNILFNELLESENLISIVDPILWILRTLQFRIYLEFTPQISFKGAMHFRKRMSQDYFKSIRYTIPKNNLLGEAFQGVCEGLIPPCVWGGTWDAIETQGLLLSPWLSVATQKFSTPPFSTK